MQECPYCSSDLLGTAQLTNERADPMPGRKSTGAELVSCPDCGGIIDGFSAH